MWDDAALTQCLSAALEVVAIVGVQLLRALAQLPWGSRGLWIERIANHELFEHARIVDLATDYLTVSGRPPRR